jgi:hypothetical protein
MAKVSPISRIHPATSDTRIELMIPRGPAFAAFFVSSVMCADAS